MKKVGIVFCGALNQRGRILEQLEDRIFRQYGTKVIIVSAISVGLMPLLLSMSNINSSNIVAVNACKYRCSDILTEKANETPTESFLLDNVIKDNGLEGKELIGCKITTNKEEYDEPALELVEKSYTKVREMVEKIAKG